MTPAEFMDIRTGLGLSREGLARALSTDGHQVSRVTIQGYEVGRYKIPAAVEHLLRAAAKFAGVRQMLGIPAIQKDHPARPRGRHD